MPLESYIRGVSFEILSSEILQRVSSVLVSEAGYFRDDHDVLQHGCLDAGLGFSQKRPGILCPTCRRTWDMCPGHVGHIVLSVPLYHPAYISYIRQLLLLLCFNCSRVALGPVCAYCNKQSRPRAGDLVTPADALRVFSHACYEDYQAWAHIIRPPNYPADLILRLLPVAPAPVRPSVQAQDGRASVDGLTTYYSKIANYNIQVRYKTSFRDYLQTWRLLQDEVASMFGVTPAGDIFQLIHAYTADLGEDARDDVDADFQQQKSSMRRYRDVRNVSILVRLSGKYGRFRSNLSGKRVNFSGRSVISPDPNLRVDELGVPYAVARSLTFPETVTARNVSEMQRMLDNDQIERVDRQACYENIQLALPPRDRKFDWTTYTYRRVEDSGAPIVFDRFETRPETRLTRLYNASRTNAMYYFTHIYRSDNDELVAGAYSDARPVPAAPNAREQQNVYYYLSIPTSAIKQRAQSETLVPGDVVHRYLQNGDYVIFNRQPSLHKASMYLFRARIHPFRTFKFNVVNCANFGADFDGDEMNVMFPQSYDAVGEASELIKHADNLIDIANNQLSMNIMQDAISGLYAMSRELFVKYEHYTELVIVDWESLDGAADYLGDVEPDNTNSGASFAQPLAEQAPLNYYESFYGKSNDVLRYSSYIDQPAIMYPYRLYTGKQIISRILKNHTQKAPLNVRSGDFCVLNSEVMDGAMTKKCIGAIFTQLANSDLASFVTRKSVRDAVLNLQFSLYRIALRFMQKSGFSIGISDVWEDESLSQIKIDLVEQSFARLGYKKYSEIQYIWKYPKLMERMRSNADMLPATELPPIEENQIQSALSDLRATISDQIHLHLFRYRNYNNNPVLIMSKSGSKGSIINQVQMTSLLSQQTVNNRMIYKYFGDRVSPHFPRQTRHYPYYFGFIQNSFFSGLNQFEFWFHTTSGREGVIDTAIKTAQTGYIQRKLSKSLETVTVDWNYNVVSDRMVVFNSNMLDGDAAQDNVVIDKINNGTAVEYLQSQLYMYLSGIQNSGMHSYVNKTQTGREVCTEFIGCFRPEFYAIVSNVMWKLDELRVRLFSALSQAERAALQRFFEWKLRSPPLVPFTPIGVLGGMALGEPTTQMTLKTFHFAGLASRISGVPRLISILNAAKVRTGVFEIMPKMSVGDSSGGNNALSSANALQQARYIQAQLQPLALAQVAEISQVVSQSAVQIEIKLNRSLLDSMAVDLTGEQVSAVLAARAKKLSADAQATRDFVKISFQSSRQDMNLALSQLMEDLKNTPVWGLRGVEMSVQEQTTSSLLSSDKFRFWQENNVGRSARLPESAYYIIYTQSPDEFLQIWNSDLVDPHLTYTTNVHDLASVLGIEAARQLIADEVYGLYADYGMAVCRFHVDLLASFMTCTGRVLGFTNQGLKYLKKGKTILLASFERTGDYLFEAAIKGTKENKITDVSEDLIFGNPFYIGTGAVELIYSADRPEEANY